MKCGEGVIRKVPKSTASFDSEKFVSAGNTVAGIFVMQKGRLRHVSQALAEFLGYVSAQVVVGKPFWELIHPDDRKQVRMGNRKRETASHSGRDFFRALRKDGSICWVAIHGGVLFLEGRPAFVGCVIGRGVMERQEGWRRNFERELRQRHVYAGIVGKSKAMQDIYGLVEELAGLECAVLITGESGTGKKLIAKALHNNWHRAFEPFVSVNCSLSDEKLLESELFGCINGAYAGVDQGKRGQFECAAGGTLLLNEIGDMPPPIQHKLLSVLEENQFERMGDTFSRKVNVRLIASTEKNLNQMVKKGEFDPKLFDHLSLAKITSPPLRERTEDIPLLVDHFRNIFNKKFGRKFEGITSETLAVLMDYPWPGNVREFERVLEHAFRLFDERLIDIVHLPIELPKHIMAAPKEAPMVNFDMEEGLSEIQNALNKTFWNKSKAAKLLGMSRQTLYRKMHEYGLL